MKRFFAKIGRFFWSWGFLKFILWTATIIVLFYVEEDWRGAHIWAVTKAKWEAKGETFDFAKFVPPTVPDEQNLAAIPLFKADQREYSPGKWTPELTTLEKATRYGNNANGDLPTLGRWVHGERADMPKIRELVAATYAKEFNGSGSSTDALAQFEALYPFIADLRAASETRPLCRFNEDYTVNPPAGRTISPLTREIRVAQLLTVHGILALDENRPDLALADIELTFKLSHGVAHDPTVVAGLVSIGMISVVDAVFFEGLARREWNDAQLLKIEELQDQLDFLTLYQKNCRSMAAEAAANIDFYRGWSGRDIYGLLGGVEYAQRGSSFFKELAIHWPPGWWDCNKSILTEYILDKVRLVDPSTHRIFSKEADKGKRHYDADAKRWDAMAPWRIWYTVSAGSFDNLLKQYSYCQSRADEALIACALERYRLAKGNYPASLDLLSPSYLAKIPHDMVTGEPYIYHPEPNGTFLLYSVGWNQIDDGGKIVFKKDAPTQIDYEQGDWIWPVAK